MKNPTPRITWELGLAEATCNVAHALDKCHLSLLLWHYSAFPHLHVGSLPLVTTEARARIHGIAKAHSDHTLRPLHRQWIATG